MAEPFVAEIRIFPFNFAPRGWAMCNGQLLSISQNTALFSLIGTYYGGNGTSNFGLPNLQGNVPVDQGNGAGLSPYVLGQTGGSATVTLNGLQVPTHSHSFSGDPNSKKEVTGVANAAPAGATTPAYSSSPVNITMAPTMLSLVGNGLPHDNMQPYLTLNFCIALIGVYPARN